MNNQETYHNFTYNTKCNIWRISFDNTDKEYALKIIIVMNTTSLFMIIVKIIKDYQLIICIDI